MVITVPLDLVLSLIPEGKRESFKSFLLSKLPPKSCIGYVIRYDNNGSFNYGQGWEAALSEATIYPTFQGALEASENLGDGTTIQEVYQAGEVLEAVDPQKLGN